MTPHLIFPRPIYQLLLCASLLSPCYAGKVKAFANPKSDFTQYRTYQWLPVKTLGKTGIIEDDPTVAPAIRAAMNRELTARGLTEVKEGGDLEVAAIALTIPVPQLEAVVFQGNVPLDYGTPIATMGRWNREGTLAVNLIDTKTKDYAWAALITESISTKPGSNVGKIPGAAGKLFSKYPAKKK
jgi:hypothetical protein